MIPFAGSVLLFTVFLKVLTVYNNVLMACLSIFGVCLQVVDHSAQNKMTAENLAIVFGPNLLWSKSEASLSLMGYVHSCALLLITNYDDLFLK